MANQVQINNFMSHLEEYVRYSIQAKVDRFDTSTPNVRAADAKENMTRLLHELFEVEE